MSHTVLTPVILLLVWLTAVRAADARTERPNIVFMLSDDQGWNGLSVAMHPDVPASKSEVFHTPHLEQFASQGMRFSAAYAPAPVCSPTRISLLTGKSPAALHWTKAAPPETGRKLNEPRLIKSISTGETTFAELLRKAGYATAHYGKWHISGGGPGEHGFDEHDGDTGNESALRFTDPNPVDLFGMADRATAFMEQNSKAKRPFFVQLSWNALHVPENALTATKAKYQHLANGRDSRRANIAAITEDLDTAVGRVLEAIDRLGLADNTFVIYMSDNGSGGGGRGGLSGGKGSLWEGGIRVPLIVRGPGVKANSWCPAPVVGYDLFSTFCAWAGVALTSLPTGIEGGSLASLLTNNGQGDVKRPREEMVFHFPHYQTEHTPHSAIYLGNLKLLKFYEDNRVALFDLSKDIGERNDLSTGMPAETARLRQRLEKYLTSVDAQLPTPNPRYDPNLASEPNREKGVGKGRKNDKKPKQ